ncbi:hypothetical protein MXB_1537, partial [Myxobolus squamalis]
MLIISLLLICTLKIFVHYRLDYPCHIKEWEKYKSEYNLDFSGEENAYRKEIFVENYRYIMESNSRNSNFTLSMNMFGHLKKNEWPKLLNLKKPIGYYENEDPIFVEEKIPSEYDWREEGVVTPVKDQRNCGSCYAFSAVGAIESQFAIHSGDFKNLSVQEIVDCSVSYGNNACGGGYMERVYNYVINNGISTYSDYPYTARYEHCKKNNSKNSHRLSGYRGLRGGDEHNLIRAIFHIGPISIAMNALSLEFQFYKSGILDIPLCDPTIFSHAVLAVGYNLIGIPYLLVKNSYGTDWGIDGYFKIALYRNNMCGISSWGTFPIIV